jgi:hypothetical protein
MHRGTTNKTSPSCLDALAVFGIERSMFATNFRWQGLRIGYDRRRQLMGQKEPIFHVSGGVSFRRKHLFRPI